MLFVVGGVTLAGIGIVYSVLSESKPPPNSRKNVALPPGSYSPKPLGPGTPMPVYEGEGWINGEPKFSDPPPRLTVVDVWAHWCPACRETAPGLVALYQKYKKYRVSFVSLTNVNRAGVESFVKAASIPWPCVYGASLESLARYGVYNPNRMTETYNPGYEITPTMFLIGADGRVLWNDDSARPQHVKSSSTLVHELELEIRRALIDELSRN